MKKLYAYCCGKNVKSYDYIIIEKKGFDKPKIIQQGSCLESFFKKHVENVSGNLYLYTKRKDYSETCNILKSLIESN